MFHSRLNICNVSESDVFLPAGLEHHMIAYVVLCQQFLFYINRSIDVPGLEKTGREVNSFEYVLKLKGRRTDSIPRKPVHVNGDGHFFFLFSEDFNP